MASRFGGFLPRIAFFVVVIVLATATLTLAAQRRATYTAPVAAPAAPPAVLHVPDVRDQAYVFAKGVLEDAGFAWRVGSGAPGYAGYRVRSQFPAAGTRVIDTGAPTVVLHIAVDAHYDAKDHAPQNRSPYSGTAVRFADTVSANVLPKAKPKPTTMTQVTPAAKPKAKPPATKPATAPVRTPAFTLAGAGAEPLDEITLPARAQQLATWVAAHPAPTNANVSYWLYQHSWIVTGARFGWWHGDEALTTLIAVDKTVQRQWDLGAKSEAEARSALEFVAAHSR